MVALQIRDVPEPLRDQLVALARQRGQSLQAFLFDLVRDEARRQDNIAVLKQFSPGNWDVAFAAQDVIVALDDERSERDSALDGPGARE
ncbi:hypothetical protein [Nocardia ignorata]|uniref:Uncharacterized protein n=1 Tax=Nocardia ignorata TaxID=145285 RepID=A0A4R6PV45_NOCIG|nr:hypothetical protein [Nocardia ignorata]TDP42197.1 hypothetical protein DFR75_1011307 [Nocardia ignorata]